MDLPSWQDKTLGSRVRAALWLETVVREGNVFTKTELREAFPEVAQIDRRLRDLRDHGWKINTRREDPELHGNEQRYVKRGAQVWLPGQAKGKGQPTAAERTRTLQRDSFLCRSCGIGPGEQYDDGVRDAQLDIARRKVRVQDGTVQLQLVTECNRCRIGGRYREEDLDSLMAEINSLSALECKALQGWIEADNRTQSPLEKIWGKYRALPADSRSVIASAVTEGSEGEASQA